MKLFYSALVCSAIYRTSNAAVQTDSGDRSFERQLGEVVEAKYNIEEPDMDERDMFNSLSDSDEVKVIVQTADSDRTRGANTLMAMSTKIGMKIESAGIYGLTVTKKQMEELARDPDFKYVEYDHNVSVVGDTTGHLRKLAEETPYGIDMVLQDMAFWNNLEEPSGSIKVCVADTGYDLGHEDLPDGGDVTGSDSSSNGAWDSDGHGHGTHCSGTVAGLGGNNEGVVGVIPDNAGGKFQLVIGKALSNSGSGSLSGVLEAVQSCVDDGAKVVSLSLGGGGYSKTTDEFYSNLYENDGILFVAAAGNGGSSSKLYPASYPALMSVAAIDSSKNKASFSQYNDQVEISAPGVSVKSSLPNDKYASWSGTSMATPHVAGVAGLLWMHFPECKNYQIRNVLAATALDLGSTDGCDTKFGYGLVQAKSAYELLAKGNCGGDIGTDAPTGGCEQLYPEPNCEVDSDCDDGDTCTVDTCDNGQCLSTPDCASCGKAKVDVEITIDNYGEETAYDIKDASGNTVMQGSGWPSNSVNSFWKCFPSGSYTFTITDGYGDGICCSYGNGGYSLKVNGDEVASGGDFGTQEQKLFVVASMCIDTPNFYNGYGGDCDSYDKYGWCVNQAAKPGLEWTVGARFKYPDRSCCVCGKEAYMITCTDTPNFNNGYGGGCGSYAKYGWCENGAAKPGLEWTLGATFKYPERNCCVCGKGTTDDTSFCEDTPKFHNSRGHGCFSYAKHGWCINGAARPGLEWTLGEKFNFPEKNCCVCGKGT